MNEAAGLEKSGEPLSGDVPANKANPSWKIHKNSFLLHLRPKSYPCAAAKFSHTYRLGYFCVFFFVVEIVTGVFLMAYYTPTPEGAYSSILRILGRVPFGDVFRDVHRLAGEAMVVCAVLHMLRVFLSGAYKGKRRFTWVTGVGLLIATSGLAFSGYLLPWDQLAYWAVTIGTSIAASVPFIGEELNLLLRGGPELGADGLLRFYLIHVVVLPVIASILAASHYYRVSRIHGISVPASIEESDVPEKEQKSIRRPIPFIPDMLAWEIAISTTAFLALLIVAAFFYDAPLKGHADYGHTPLDAQAPWFFLWMQGLLKLGDKTLAGVFIPAFLLLILFCVPYIDRSPRRSLKKRPLAAAACLAAVTGTIFLSFAGTHRYGIDFPPAVRILNDMAPEEKEGPVEKIPYAQLAPGIYTAASEEGEMPDLLGEFFSDFRDRAAGMRREGISDAEAIMIVEERQAGLKRVTLRIVWQDPEGNRKSAEIMLHLHRDG